MKFFSVAVVVALFCAVTVSAAPFTNDLTLIDEDSFGTFSLTETITKQLNALIEKTKCSLDVIEDVIKGTELEDVFKKFRAGIESVLKNDVKQCLQTEGVTGKLKCSLAISKKVGSLNVNFMKDVLKTNTEVAKKIFKSLVQCAKKNPDQPEKPEEFISNEEFAITAFDDEVTFGLTETVTRLLNSLIEKTKCTLDVIEDVIKGTELEDVFKKFRAEIKSILKNDVKKCWNTEGGLGKLKCTLGVSKKVNSLYLNFIKDVLKTNVDVAKKILKSLVKCAKKQPDQTEQPEFISDEDVATFGLADAVTKVLNSLIEKTNCALNSVEDVIGEGELRNVYRKYRTDVESILKNDVKQCLQTKGLIARLKCILSVSQKLNTLYANFVKEVLKTNKDLAGQIGKAVVKCLKKPEQPEKPEEPEKPEFISLSEEVATFGLADVVSKIINALIEKSNCALNAIEDVIGEGELRNVFRKYRTDVESILKNDVKQCVQTKGLIARLKCILTVSQKLNTLYANFVKEVLKTNKDLGGKIAKAVFKCLKKPEEPEKPEKPEKPEVPEFISNEEVASGAVDSVTKFLNALIEKTKCTLDVVQDLLGDGELAGAYKKFRAEVESILNNDVKQCEKADGFVGKLNCTLSVSQKLNTLIADFVNKVVKTSGDLGAKVYKAILQCAKKSMF